ncbi:MAG: type II secretion system protein, partial [Clostridiales bacterium]|nr:type II secretion system protein [Clostridiales bacterium]
MKKHTYKKAFTIVELIIVIAVIGVLAAILIPAFTNIIAKANSKSALSDARNTLTAFLAENLEVVDGSIATSIVIFINKAKMYYVYGYSNSGPDMGKLMQSGGNPFDYDDLEQLINDYNLQNEADATIEEIAETKAFFLRTTPSCTVKGGTKDMEAINSTYINLTDRMGDGLPDTSQVFDGYLVGMVVE